MTRPPMILGLTGPAGCGKDTVAQLLTAMLPDCHVMAFADALRDEVARAFCREWTVFGHAPPEGSLMGLPGRPWRVLTERQVKELPHPALRPSQCLDEGFVAVLPAEVVATDACMSPRQVLQWWGTEYRRGQDEHYWLHRMAERLERAAWERARFVVVPGVRFPNEVALLRARGGLMLRVQRPGVQPVALHVSERALDDVRMDMVLANAGSLEELEVRVRHLALDLLAAQEAAHAA